jgi:FkbM family methyltransferase
VVGLRDRLERRHRHAAATARLGATRRDAFALWALMLLPAIKHRIPRVRDRPLSVDVELRGERHRLVLADRSDAVTLHDLFVRGEYDLGLADAPRTVVDLGAHGGLSVLLFRAAFPGVEVLAIEPNPASFERLRANVGALPGVQLRHCAVGAADGEASLDVRGESWAARLDAAGTVRVPLRRLDGLLREAGVDETSALLKIDVEGAEWEVLSSLGPPLRFAAVVGEFHPRLAPVDADRFFSLFEGFDVSRPTGTDVFTAIRTVG